ncbi:uncharacterized protein LOC129579856, partial [Sitodiplosis mosellana]|uniref:uncharacterized protein LOC129579856 n=1 Tax=Sitodiplosis mosellana TaxID=263140 RepID=UPI0024443F17
YTRPEFTIDGVTKLLIAIRFYRVGANYMVICDMFGISYATVQNIVWEVSFLIAQERDRFIFMPTTQEEILQAKADFMSLAHFSLCIAAVDGTHVPINSFGGPDAELYRNRHLFFSMKVQLAVSADERILDVVARWPESAHDSRIFTNSNLCDRFRRGEFGEYSVLVADSAYPPERFICEPLNHVVTINKETYQD